MACQLDGETVHPAEQEPVYFWSWRTQPKCPFYAVRKGNRRKSSTSAGTTASAQAQGHVQAYPNICPGVGAISAMRRFAPHSPSNWWKLARPQFFSETC